MHSYYIPFKRAGLTGITLHLCLLCRQISFFPVLVREYKISLVFLSVLTFATLFFFSIWASKVCNRHFNGTWMKGKRITNMISYPNHEKGSIFLKIFWRLRRKIRQRQLAFNSDCSVFLVTALFVRCRLINSAVEFETICHCHDFY